MSKERRRTLCLKTTGVFTLLFRALTFIPHIPHAVCH